MKEHFGLKGELKEITISMSGKGKILINTITPTLKNGSWTGKYYSDFPITLSIDDSSGKFKGWSGDVDSNEKIIKVTLTKSFKIQANFS